MARGKSLEQANILERQLRALDLRKRGLSYRDIGAKLDISHEQARRDIEGELKRLAKLRDGVVETERELDLIRLDAMIKGLEPMAIVGMPQAVAAMLKCLERRAKLLGLDAPTKTDITSGGEALKPVVFLPQVDDSQ